MAFTNLQLDPAQLPAAQDIVYLPLERRYVLARTGLAAALTLLLGAAVAVAVLALLPEVWRPALGVLIVTPLFPILAYVSAQRCGYALREQDIALRRGVFRQRQIIQPFVRIQHIELARNPLDKRLQLAGLKVFSAGTGTETMMIPGLSLDTAQSIRSRLLQAQKALG